MTIRDSTSLGPSVFPQEYPLPQASLEVEDLSELNERINRFYQENQEKIPTEKPSQYYVKRGQVLLEAVENLDRIDDFCSYVDLGFQLVSGTLNHFIGNVLIHGASYQLIPPQAGTYGAELQSQMELGSSIVDGIFASQNLISILIRKQRLDLAHHLKDLISKRLSQFENSLSESQNDQLSHTLAGLEQFIASEKVQLKEVEILFALSVSRTGLSTAADILSHFNLVTPLVQSFGWVASLLGIASSSVTLHYELQKQKHHSHWIKKREKKGPPLDQVQKLLEKRQNYFEETFQKWIRIDDFESLRQMLSKQGIDLGQFQIKTLADWQSRVGDLAFKEEIKNAYLAHAADGRRRADLIKQLALEKQKYQKKEVDFNVLKKKVLFSFSLASTVTSVTLAILIFCAVLVVPGFVLGLPALALFTATAVLFFVGLHRMRTQRPFFFKNYFPLRARYITNKIKIFFKDLYLKSLKHQIKELVKTTRHELDRHSRDPENQADLKKKIEHYSLQRKQLDSKKELLQNALAKIEQQTTEVYKRLNCIRAMDFLHQQGKLSSLQHQNVQNYLNDFVQEILSGPSLDSRVIKNLQKDMGINLFDFLDQDEQIDQAKLIGAIAEFLGHSENDLLSHIKAADVKHNLIKHKITQLT